MVCVMRDMVHGSTESLNSMSTLFRKIYIPGTGISFVLIIGSEIRLHEMAKHENTALSKKHILSLFWVFG